MKRKIKFRGKTKGGTWIYGSYYYRRDTSPVIETQETYVIHYIIEFADFNKVSEYEVLPESVSQFTGMYDDNNKEIYEGDIVCSDELYFEKYLVKFHQGNFIVEPFNTVRPLRDPLDESYSIGVFSPDFKLAKTKLKIIGNVYEDK